MNRLQPSAAAGERSELHEERLCSDRMELSILPRIGCHWARLRVSLKGERHDLLFAAPDVETLLRKSSGFGSYLMSPWSNRIAGARFQFEGTAHPLRANFPDGTAIHGDVRGRPWTVLDATEERFEARLDSRDFADFNYPFALCFRQRLELAGDRLRVEHTIENVGRARAPAGFGFHPYFRRRLTPREQDVILVLPAAKVYPARGCIPTGPAEAVEGRTDLRTLRPLGAPDLDHCFTDLASPEIRLVYPRSGLEVRLRVDPVFTHAVVFAPNEAGGQAKEYVAVEPVTNVNDGFNLLARGWAGTGVKVLEPGETWGGAWELTVGDI